MKTVEQWTSKLGFILVAAGSAIGIGGIWKFPYVVATSGGGAFFLLFFVFTLAIGLPLLLAEFIIGRSTGKQAIAAYKQIAPRTRWHWIAYLGMGTCFLLLSFYSVVGGWILLYLMRAIAGILLVAGQNYDALFLSTVKNSWAVVIAQGAFIGITIVVVGRGIKVGIERASRILMPALFLLFLILIIHALTLPGMSAGLLYFLNPDFSKLTGQAILNALGQSFFCLSVGVSVMVTYSSYLQKKESIIKCALSVSGLNIMTSLMAGLAIFPALFALGIQPQAGPALLFSTLPALFANMPFGNLFIILFLSLFLFAALTSAFSMLEILVSNCISGCKWNRRRLSLLLGVFIFITGIPSALSFGIWSNIKIFGLSLFNSADFVVTNLLMPIGALLIALFVGYRYPYQQLKQQFQLEAILWQRSLVLYVMLLRYIIPVAIVLVFLHLLQLI